MPVRSATGVLKQLSGGQPRPEAHTWNMEKRAQTLTKFAPTGPIIGAALSHVRGYANVMRLRSVHSPKLGVFFVVVRCQGLVEDVRLCVLALYPVWRLPTTPRLQERGTKHHI